MDAAENAVASAVWPDATVVVLDVGPGDVESYQPKVKH